MKALGLFMSESKIERFNFKLAFRRNEIIGKWESAIAIAIELATCRCLKKSSYPNLKTEC